MTNRTGGDNASSFQQLAAAAVVLILAFGVIALLFGALWSAAPPGDNEPFEPSVDGTSFDADELHTVSVVDSTGYAVEFGPSDGNVVASVDPLEDDMAMSAWVALDDDANLERDYYVAQYADGDLILLYESGDWVAYHAGNESAGNVSIEAETPQDLTHVGVETDGQNISIVQSGEIVASDSLEEEVDIPEVRPLHGTVEELRAFDSTLTDEEWQQLEEDPVAPLEPGSESVRMMFDEGDGNETEILYHDESATLAGDFGWTDGLEGSEFEEGVDYTITEDTISVVEGSSLADLPRAYATYDTASGIPGTARDVGSIISQAFVLGGVALIVLVAGFIMRKIQVGGEGGRI